MYFLFCVTGYDAMGFEMSKPHLRSGLEADLVKIWSFSFIQRYIEVYIQFHKTSVALKSFTN